MRFYIGLHQPADAKHFGAACISINRLRTRSKPLGCPDVLVDSGAFTELNLHGAYRHSVAEYASALRRLHECGAASISAAVAQDYMCEPFMLKKTGLDVPTHQRLTIERYDALLEATEDLPFPIMPVLQGFAPDDYARHLEAYGDRLPFGAWVGVGSVCKRQGDPELVVAVLWAILAQRPDLRLHGFGVKRTALLHAGVRHMLETADSMAWSDHERKNQTKRQNDWRAAAEFAAHVNEAAGRAFQPWQIPLL